MKRKSIFRDERGFWSAFFFLFLVTLGLLGMGAYALMKSEGVNVANEMKSMQAKNSLEAAAFYGLTALKKSLFTGVMETTTLTIGGTTVNLDTSRSGSDLILRVTATNGAVSRQLKIQVQYGKKFSDNAVATTGDVSNVTALDSLRNPDPDRLIDNQDSLPTFKDADIKAMAFTQGHKKTGNWTATTNYPAANFYNAGTTPNVTHITGNLTMNGTTNIYGIFIVEGTVTMNGTGRIYGVLYLPNSTSTVIKSSTIAGESAVEGGIISHGSISGTVSNITVEHVPAYMRSFMQFRTYTEIISNPVVGWTYS
jgi:hypothetical protein